MTAATAGAPEALELVARTEERLAELDALEAGPGGASPDGAAAAARAAAAVESLVALYGACLARIAGLLDAEALRRLADDELVGHLLLVHDRHPDPPAVRARRVLEELGTGLRARGGELELLEVTDTAVRVRLRAGGCGSSAAGTEEAERSVRDALAARSPEIEDIEVASGAGSGDGSPRTLIPVDALFRSPAPAAGSPG